MARTKFTARRKNPEEKKKQNRQNKNGNPNQPASPAIKKPRRAKPGERALREIRKYVKSVHFYFNLDRFVDQKAPISKISKINSKLI